MAGPGAPYVKGSDTSLEAAEEAVSFSASLREQILDHIQKLGGAGATCDEVEVSFGLRHQTASARIRELVQVGSLKDSGARRKTRSGRGAVVWVRDDGTDPRPETPNLDAWDILKGDLGADFLSAFTKWAQAEQKMDLSPLIQDYFDAYGADLIDFDAVVDEGDALQSWYDRKE